MHLKATTRLEDKLLYKKLNSEPMPKVLVMKKLIHYVMAIQIFNMHGIVKIIHLLKNIPFMDGWNQHQIVIKKLQSSD